MDDRDKLTNEQIAPFARDAAIAWCGQKERETFPDDVTYFVHNWRAQPGLRAFAERHALRALASRDDAEKRP